MRKSQQSALFCATNHQLFYCNQRGINTEDAIGLIVNGYAKEVPLITDYSTYSSLDGLYGANNTFDEVMGKTMIDYDVVGLNETKLMDVFEHHAPNEKKEEKNDVPEYEEQK